MSTLTTPAAALLLLLATTLLGQDTTEPPCDRNAIQWLLPGTFPEALARAQQDQRILVIKGISFGVDTEGARCATKGVW